jgi:hypothetical protein
MDYPRTPDNRPHRLSVTDYPLHQPAPRVFVRKR